MTKNKSMKITKVSNTKKTFKKNKKNGKYLMKGGGLFSCYKFFNDYNFFNPTTEIMYNYSNILLGTEMLAKFLLEQMNEVASGVADVTLELMEDSVDWQIAEWEASGDTYDAIHREVIEIAVSKMYEELKR